MTDSKHRGDAATPIGAIETEGWKLAPVAPDAAMLAAGEKIAPGKARAVWDAMMGQAPSAGWHVE